MPDVDILQSGRGGTIYYREAHFVVALSWEFALPPAIALIYGPRAASWDADHPWAAGRQRAVYEFVGAEMVRQQVPGGSAVLDLDAGVIEVLRATPAVRERIAAPRRRRQSAALERFLASVVPMWEQWPPEQTYDLDAVAALRGGERERALALLTSRDVTWREVGALARIDLPGARQAIEAATRDHLSIDTRLAAAEVLAARGDGGAMEPLLARQIRALYQSRNGEARTLRLAESHDGPVIRQALLWASWNQTECSSACAALLLRLTHADAALTDDARASLLARLGLHNSYFTRKAAFDELCALVSMELDTTQDD